MQEAVALNKKRQSKFAKKAAKVKSKVQKGEVTLNENESPSPKRKGPPRGLVYVGHIPHGFFEEEMRSYFSQFGVITNVRVCRCYKTGKSKGFGFVQFQLPEIAEVAAQTMDNYLMFKRRLEVKNIPPEKQKHNIFKGKGWSEATTPYKKTIKQATRQRNTDRTDQQHLKSAKKQLGKLNKTMKKLKDLGIEYNFQPVEVPTTLISSPMEKVKKTKKILKEKPGKAKKLTKRKPVSVETEDDDSPKKPQKSVKRKLKNEFVSETEHDTSVEEVQKKKVITKKRLGGVKKAAPVKKISDKLKQATMSILDSDMIVKKSKIEKKVNKKKK